MAEYFDTLPFHVKGHIDFDVSSSKTLPKICSIGTDDTICLKDVNNG